MSPQQKFAANPVRGAASLLCVVSILAEEDGAEIAVAEARDSELAVVDGGKECSVMGSGTEGAHPAAAPLRWLFRPLQQLVESSGVVDGSGSTFYAFLGVCSISPNSL